MGTRQGGHDKANTTGADVPKHVAWQLRTLDEVDPPAWSARSKYDTNLVSRCHELRSVPLGELTLDDLRMLIGQRIGIAWLVPIALELLRVDPLLEATFYRGDMLVTIMKQTPDYYWEENPDQLEVLRDALGRVEYPDRDSVDFDAATAAEIQILATYFLNPDGVAATKTDGADPAAKSDDHAREPDAADPIDEIDDGDQVDDGDDDDIDDHGGSPTDKPGPYDHAMHDDEYETDGRRFRRLTAAFARLAGTAPVGHLVHQDRRHLVVS